MNNKKYWNEFYKTAEFKEQSTFADFCLPYIDGDFVDLGCGDGRDLRFFLKQGKIGYGVDASNEGVLLLRSDVLAYMKNTPAPKNVYTRFFWHAIDRTVQKEILTWTSGRLFIEARTTKDKPKNVCGRHSRVLVDVARLKRDLDLHGFKIIHLSEGRGLSIYKGEDPHLVRVIAEKS